MLRTKPVYDITVTTTDGYELNYLFLTHPTPAALLEATRARQEVDTEEGASVRYNALREVLPLLREIPKPELKKQVVADITVASVKVGIIQVLCHPATEILSNRGRKRKTDLQTERVESLV